MKLTLEITKDKLVFNWQIAQSKGQHTEPLTVYSVEAFGYISQVLRDYFDSPVSMKQIVKERGSNGK